MIAVYRSETKCDYIKGNISDVDDNAYYEAEGPFVCIYVEIRYSNIVYSNIVIRSISECSITRYPSDIV